MARVIITGATGLIGKALTKYLLDNGYEVVALSRDLNKAKNVIDSRAITAQWDAATSRNWAHYADGADAIVNLAGENVASMWTEKKKRDILESRLNATNAVVEAIRNAIEKPKVVIQGSAIGFYGPGIEKQLDESAPPGQGFLADVSKRWEEAAIPIKQFGTRLVFIRSGIVLSTEGGALEPVLRSFKFFSGGYIGSGEQWYSWIAIDDEIGIIRFLIEHGQLEGPFNLVSPNPVRLKAFAQTLGKALAKPAWLRVPAAALRIAFDQMADELLLNGQLIAPARILAAGYQFKYPELETALRHILKKA